jgi:flagellar FliL protein
MADEKENNEESVEKQEKPASKKKSPLPIIIGAVVVLLVLGGGGFFLFNYMNSAKAAEGTDGTDGATDTTEITETNIYFSGFDTNVVNLASSTEYEYMYLKYGFDLELSDPGLASELTMKLPRLSSEVAGVMSNRDWGDICTAQGRERVAREAMRALNEQLTTGQVIGLYFTTFVAQ